MELKRVLLFLFAGVFFISCKKQILPSLDEGNEPIYYLSGAVDGELFNQVAGENGIEFSHGTEDFNGVQNLYGQFKSTVGEDVLKIAFIPNDMAWKGNDYIPFTNVEMAYLENKTHHFAFDFGGVGNQLKYLLVKGNSGIFEPAHSLTFQAYGKYRVEVRFEDVEGYEIFDFEMNNGFNNFELTPMFSSEGIEKNCVFTAKNTDYMHEWYLNGVFVGKEPVYADSLENGVHSIKHIISDFDGNSASHSTLIRVKEGKYFWQMNLNPTAGSKLENNYGKVLISYFKDGIWYYSTKSGMNVDNAFKISDLKTIKKSENKDTFLIFTTLFDCVLYNEEGTESISLSEFTGQFGIKY